MADPDRIRNRALGALAAVVAVALGVGGILAIGAYATARFAGLTDNSGGQSGTAHAVAAAPPRAPSPTPASGNSTGAGDSSGHHQDAAQQAGHRDRPTRRQHAQPQQRSRAHQRHQRAHRHAHSQVRRHQQHRRHRHQAPVGAVTLHASQTRVRPMARVDLGGRCGCRSGTTLVVQRREAGHWTRFPASATASNGRFHTWVMTGRQGPNQFRVVLPGGPASNPVTITVT
jgi:hypothetical protein